MNTKDKVQKTACEYLGKDRSIFYTTALRSVLTDECKQMAKQLKQEGHKISIHAMVAEVDRQSNMRRERFEKRHLYKDDLLTRRNNFVTKIAIENFITQTSLSRHELTLIVNENPNANTNVIEIKRWGKQYPDKRYLSSVSVCKNWKSQIYDKGFSFINGLFVTHILRQEQVDSLIIREVFCAKKSYEHMVDPLIGVMIEKDGEKFICKNAKEFNSYLNKIKFKFTKEQKQLLLDIEDNYKVCVRLSNTGDRFSLFNAIKGVIE